MSYILGLFCAVTWSIIGLLEALLDKMSETQRYTNLIFTCIADCMFDIKEGHAHIKPTRLAGHARFFSHSTVELCFWCGSPFSSAVGCPWRRFKNMSCLLLGHETESFHKPHALPFIILYLYAYLSAAAHDLVYKTVAFFPQTVEIFFHVREFRWHSLRWHSQAKMIGLSTGNFVRYLLVKVPSDHKDSPHCRPMCQIIQVLNIQNIIFFLVFVHEMKTKVQALLWFY